MLRAFAPMSRVLLLAIVCIGLRIGRFTVPGVPHSTWDSFLTNDLTSLPGGYGSATMR